MDYFNFYKELYFKENERRQEVNSALNIPLAVITALSSGTYFLITSFAYKADSFLSLVFVLLMVLTGITLLISIYFLIRAFSDFSKGYEYLGIPYVNELYNWHQELEEYCKTYELGKDHTDELFETYLLKNLVKHTDHNMYVNDKKLGYIYLSKKFLIGALVLIFISLIPFGNNFFKKDNEVHQIQVVSNSPSDEILQIEYLTKKIDSLIISQKTIEYELLDELPQKTTTTTTSSSKR